MGKYVNILFIFNVKQQKIEMLWVYSLNTGDGCVQNLGPINIFLNDINKLFKITPFNSFFSIA